ncbi:zinc ribbon domain-containing protein [Williamwhitmania taraxaci]|uniref:Uncharacterized protein n=1 Tax=Williamwhitmania taraxaci TaxID=1640674 RepID=A0A1G6MPQ3_9BACT|nr:hypothetical protein [Williamwhitmania taraxaci]SDC56966.1 hypothetical protein SAMN05216323_103725 [Williamwhitmania taraxaci]
MYYLACNHCGHLNQAISVNSVLCTQCGKKMENSFTHWKESHPKGSHNQYLKECCIDEAALRKSRQAQLQQDKKRRTRRTIALILGVIVVLFSIIAFVGYGGMIKNAFLDAIHSSNEREWSEQFVGTEGLVLSFPKTFESADAIIEQIPPAIRSRFEKVEVSIAGFNKNFIALAFTIVTNESDTGSLNRYADIGLSLLTGSRRIDNANIKTEEYTINNLPAILQQGTFVSDGKPRSSFSMLLVGKDKNFWLIMVVFPTDDTKAQQITQRLIQSAEVRPKTD